jgi:hypothetical protein
MYTMQMQQCSDASLSLTTLQALSSAACLAVEGNAFVSTFVFNAVPYVIIPPHAMPPAGAAAKRQRGDSYEAAAPPAFSVQQQQQQQAPGGQAVSPGVLPQYPMVTITFDGGSRNNPGRAGYGYAVFERQRKERVSGANRVFCCCAASPCYAFDATGPVPTGAAGPCQQERRKESAAVYMQNST